MSLPPLFFSSSLFHVPGPLRVICRVGRGGGGGGQQEISLTQMYLVQDCTVITAHTGDRVCPYSRLAMCCAGDGVCPLCCAGDGVCPYCQLCCCRSVLYMHTLPVLSCSTGRCFCRASVRSSVDLSVGDLI